MFDFNLPSSDPSNPNNYVMTPEQRAIRLAAALRQQQAGSDSSPIRSPWQGAARLAQGLMGGLDEGNLNAQQNQGAASNQSALVAALNGGDTSNMDIPAQTSTPFLSAADKSQDYNQDAPDNSSPLQAAPPSPSSPAGQSPAAAAMPTGDHADFITKTASGLGIDPQIALRVAQSEGLGQGPGDGGSSFGDYQMHLGGIAPGGNAVAGLGDDFKKQTGLDPQDPKNWQALDTFALQTAARKGSWGDFHGAARVGIADNAGFSPAAPPVPPVANIQAALRAGSGLPISTAAPLRRLLPRHKDSRRR
jgi:hypothetical protein